jgi:hypothetical protein
MMLLGQRMTHARGGVIDTLPMGIEPNPVLRQDGSWRLLNAVLAGCANSIGAVRYADSERWIGGPLTR